MGRPRFWPALAALLVLSGCAADKEPMPYGIRSLAVLPPDVAPFHEMAGRVAGEHVSQALKERTTFRIVGIGSTTRLLSDTPGQILYQRFRDQAKSAGRVDHTLAELMARRLGVNGLALPMVQLSMSEVAGGQVSLSLAVFEGDTGEPAWKCWRQRAFTGLLGEPGFNRVLAALADEEAREMPLPMEEDRW